MVKRRSDLDEDASQKYRAPALEKGLDILELLSQSPRPMSPKLISEKLERSVSELFRMLQVLESRGYVAIAENQSGYELTNKLFTLAKARGISKNLLDHALPAMRTLSENTLQACHLVVPSDDQIVVIGQMDAPTAPSFHIRSGFRQAVVESAAGVVLYAFQRPNVRLIWSDALRETVGVDDWTRFADTAEQALSDGYIASKSAYSESVTDISCPVFNDRGVVAALTIPFIKSKFSTAMEGCVTEIVAAARDLSAALGANPEGLAV